MSEDSLELVQTSRLIDELLGRYEHAIFAGLNVMVYGENGEQHVRRKWTGNSVTCQGLAWTLANAVDRELNEESKPLED
jgi:hypothetical protein